MLDRARVGHVHLVHVVPAFLIVLQVFEHGEHFRGVAALEAAGRDDLGETEFAARHADIEVVRHGEVDPALLASSSSAALWENFTDFYY